MFPYITIGTTKLHMTGIGIVISLVFFLIISGYLAHKYKQNFLALFYKIPFIIIGAYILGVYFDFLLNSYSGLIPTTTSELFNMLSPYKYKFNFIGVVLAITAGFSIFIKQIKRYETKKVWIDILFFSTAFSMIPLGFFFLLGDSVIGEPTNSILGIQSLHFDSALNKFTSVYPIGFFLIIGSLISTTIIGIAKKKLKKFGLGIIGFILLIISTNIVIIFQQYARHGVMKLLGFSIDIKQYFSFLLIMYCLRIYYKRKQY